MSHLTDLVVPRARPLELAELLALVRDVAAHPEAWEERLDPNAAERATSSCTSMRTSTCGSSDGSPRTTADGTTTTRRVERSMSFAARSSNRCSGSRTPRRGAPMGSTPVDEDGALLRVPVSYPDELRPIAITDLPAVA